MARYSTYCYNLVQNLAKLGIWMFGIWTFTVNVRLSKNKNKIKFTWGGGVNFIKKCQIWFLKLFVNNIKDSFKQLKS